MLRFPSTVAVQTEWKERGSSSEVSPLPCVEEAKSSQQNFSWEDAVEREWEIEKHILKSRNKNIKKDKGKVHPKRAGNGRLPKLDDIRFKPVTAVNPEIPIEDESRNVRDTSQAAPIAWSVAVQTVSTTDDDNKYSGMKLTKPYVSYEAKGSQDSWDIVKWPSYILKKKLDEQAAREVKPDEGVKFPVVYMIAAFFIFLSIKQFVLKSNTMSFYLRELLYATCYLIVPPSWLHYSDEILDWVDKRFINKQQDQSEISSSS